MDTEKKMFLPASLAVKEYLRMFHHSLFSKIFVKDVHYDRDTRVENIVSHQTHGVE